ncbi:MAG: hypothetical protein JWN70_2721 [Planctomycetaceae bacterium]|nr:hypothetical protein [Planctomycetaceae bacterium]
MRIASCTQVQIIQRMHEFEVCRMAAPAAVFGIVRTSKRLDEQREPQCKTAEAAIPRC